MPATRPVAFVTGASAGIGAACVRLFARSGWDVVAAARRKERIEELCKELAGAVPEARLVAVQCDVASDESVRSAFDEVRSSFGRLDALVNNAGIGSYGCVGELPLSEFRSNMETNYFGVLRCTQAALPLLRATAAQSGRKWGAAVVMISSFCGRRSVPEFGAYGASKYALEGLSEALRLELKADGVSVSVVNPGVVKTDFFSQAHGTRPPSYVPPARGMSGEDVARVVLKLTKRPRRNVYLTLPCKAGVFLQWLAPGFFDYFIWREWRRGSERSTSAKG
jgi:NAD(P)-dependent dehydrogenase (short-subunit alcohol dehydrogenase family)